MFQAKVVQKIKTYILLAVFLQGNPTVRNINRKNTVQSGHRLKYRAFHKVLRDYKHL